MSDKEKADCFLELNKSKLDHFMQTRTIEFQINVAIWTLIVGGGAYLYEKIYLVGCISWIVFIFIAIIIFIVHLVWMLLIQNSEDIDHSFMNEYRRIIDQLTEISVKESQPREELKPAINLLKKYSLRGWHWVILETMMTLVLLVGVGILLSLPRNNDVKQENLNQAKSQAVVVSSGKMV